MRSQRVWPAAQRGSRGWLGRLVLPAAAACPARPGIREFLAVSQGSRQGSCPLRIERPPFSKRKALSWAGLSGHLHSSKSRLWASVWAGTANICMCRRHKQPASSLQRPGGRTAQRWERRRVGRGERRRRLEPGEDLPGWWVGGRAGRRTMVPAYDRDRDAALSPAQAQLRPRDPAHDARHDFERALQRGGLELEDVGLLAPELGNVRGRQPHLGGGGWGRVQGGWQAGALRACDKSSARAALLQTRRERRPDFARPDLTWPETWQAGRGRDRGVPGRAAR